MRVHHDVDVRVSHVHLAVDVPLDEALGRIGVERLAVDIAVLHEVAHVADQCGRHVRRHQVGRVVQWVPH